MVIIKLRYKLWNHIDMPERFGERPHNRVSLVSHIELIKKLSIITMKIFVTPIRNIS